MFGLDNFRMSADSSSTRRFLLHKHEHTTGSKSLSAPRPPPPSSAGHLQTAKCTESPWTHPCGGCFNVSDQGKVLTLPRVAPALKTCFFFFRSESRAVKERRNGGASLSKAEECEELLPTAARPGASNRGQTPTSRPADVCCLSGRSCWRAERSSSRPDYLVGYQRWGVAETMETRGSAESRIGEIPRNHGNPQTHTYKEIKLDHWPPITRWPVDEV